MATCLTCQGSGIDYLDISLCDDCSGTGSDSYEIPDDHQPGVECRCDHCIPFQGHLMTFICYWSFSYISPEPFCLSRKMTDQENFIFDEFQQLLAVERLEIIKTGGAGGAPRLRDVEADKPTVLTIDGQTMRAIVAKSEQNKKFFGFLFAPKKVPVGFGLYNIQTIAAIEAKTPFLRSDFLAR